MPSAGGTSQIDPKRSLVGSSGFGRLCPFLWSFNDALTHSAAAYTFFPIGWLMLSAWPLARSFSTFSYAASASSAKLEKTKFLRSNW